MKFTHMATRGHSGGRSAERLRITKDRPLLPFPGGARTLDGGGASRHPPRKFNGFIHADSRRIQRDEDGRIVREQADR